MKYDPAHHHNVIRNLKDSYKGRFDAELTLPDEEIWRIFERDFGLVSDDPDDRELPIFEGLWDAMNPIKLVIKDDDISALWTMIDTSI